MIELLNQLFEIEAKTARLEGVSLSRNIRRMYHELDACGYVAKNPLGEKFTEQRTDVEASLTCDYHDNMKITRVLKPIVYKREGGTLVLVQKGIVMVA